MKKRLLLLACCVVVAGSLSHSRAQDVSTQARLTGKWTQHYTGLSLEGASLIITSVDSSSGRITGKWIPPSGPAGGKEFEVIGWVSSAPPRDKADNVITISFTVSLTTYGSLTSYTGYFKDNKITASWFNVKPNSAYEWDHISTGQDIFTKSP
jgi:hypothetical protein